MVKYSVFLNPQKNGTQESAHLFTQKIRGVNFCGKNLLEKPFRVYSQFQYLLFGMLFGHNETDNKLKNVNSSQFLLERVVISLHKLLRK